MQSHEVDKGNRLKQNELIAEPVANKAARKALVASGVLGNTVKEASPATACPGYADLGRFAKADERFAEPISSTDTASATDLRLPTVAHLFALSAARTATAHDETKIGLESGGQVVPKQAELRNATLMSENFTEKPMERYAHHTEVFIWLFRDASNNLTNPTSRCKCLSQGS